MNSLQRYLNTIKGEPVDFLPRVPILMQFAAEYIGSNYGAFAADHHVLVEANMRCRDAFDFDQVSVISDPYRETQGFGGKIRYEPKHPPVCEQIVVPDIGNLDTLPDDPDPYHSERMLDRVLAVRAFKKLIGGSCSILGWVEGPAAEAADLHGVEAFLMDILMEPEATAELMRRCTQTAIRFARAQVAEGADTIGIGDAICSQIPPDIYRELVRPLQRELFDVVHAAGALVKLHICGDITHLLPHIADLPVDILDLDHMVDPAFARRCVGSRMAIAGRMDPVSEVLRGTPETIRAAVAADYRNLGNPHLVMAGCEIPSGTPPENLKALCEPVAFQEP
jgi:MtaA/CmuA family methyltransferase